MNNQVLATEISIKHSVVNLRKWINHLLNQWKWVLLFAFLGGVLGFMYAYNKQTIYIAKTTFVLEDGNSDGG